MDSWHSYPSIYNMGHRAIAELLNGTVLVEEKIDGSQFSFGITADGEIKARSKGAILNTDAPEKMFDRAVESVKQRAENLRIGWTYRAEYLQKPKHNSLAYDRVPNGHLIIFDINTGEADYLDYDAKAAEATRIGLEVVPLIYRGTIGSIELFKSFLDCVSILGGQKIEGVVIKPELYGLFGQDKKCLLGKFVSEAFKEVHRKEWKKSNPTNGDVLEVLGQAYRNMARWNKAIQHLRESGLLTESPKDIGLLLKEVQSDIGKECKEEIQAALFKWAWPHIQRKAIAGLPEWYKDELLKKQFPEQSEVSVMAEVK